MLVVWAILVLGVDIWFRNEAGTHLRWFQNHPGFWEALKFPGIINHYRPVSFLMLSVINQLFGQAALPFILANFIGFLFTLVCYYMLVRQNTNDTVAYFSLMALFPLFNHILYYPFNALHGIFYSWDVGWFCLAFYWFITGFRDPDHRGRDLLLTVIFALIALGTHAFAGLTLAVMMLAFLVFHLRMFAKNAWMMVVGISVPLLFVVLISLMEPSGEKILSPETSLMQYIGGRIELMGRIIMFPRIAPLIFAGIVQLIVYRIANGRFTSPLWAIAAGILVVAIMTAVPISVAQVMLLILMVMLLVFVLFFVPYYRIFALMALLGLVHYMLVRGESSNYLRFFIFGITPLIISGLFITGKNILTFFKIPRPKESQLSSWALVFTVLIIGGVVMGTMDVPTVRIPVRKIRYLVHLSQTFHGMIFDGTEYVPKNGRIYFFKGHTLNKERELQALTRTQAQEIATLYTRAHLYNLRPAKSYEYLSYFALTGRTDLQFGFIESGVILYPNQPVYLYAFNIYEVLRVRTKFPKANMIYHVQQGQAEAAIFKLIESKKSDWISKKIQP